MILFTILAIIVMVAMVIAGSVLAVGGSVFLVLFGDLIVFIIIIGLIIKIIKHFKKK